jgi:hypothetical protein
MAATATDVVLSAVVRLNTLALFALAHRGEVCLRHDAIAEIVRVFDLSALWRLLELAQICVCCCLVFWALKEILVCDAP